MSNYQSSWHRESYDRFLQERLPELLSERLPLAGYKVEFPSELAATVTVAVAGPSGEVSTTFGNLPRPDVDGIFWPDPNVRNDPFNQINERHPKVVVPVADSEDFEIAGIKCVGEVLLDYVDVRLGDATEGLPWDESLLRAWLPLDTWIDGFLANNDPVGGIPVAQILDITDGLSRMVHVRRVYIPTGSGAKLSGQIGRACPFETPEGPNVHKVRSISLGARVQDGRIVIVDDAPEAGLGLTASLIPFIEHSVDARLMMGCNMMRQWMPMPEPEPALVQTGMEPDAPGIWCGRNLLTAYVPWGEDVYEDAVIVSVSCARRLSAHDHWRGGRDVIAVRPGDRVSNRHGAKSTISRILPDADMPHLNGMAVDIVYSPCGLMSRQNLGQLWEATAGRIAQATGKPMIAPPFHGPSQAELRAALTAADLPDDGLDLLTDGAGGRPMDRPSCVGWVYWGRLLRREGDNEEHTVNSGGRGEASARSSGADRGQQLRYVEYAALRDVGAFETIREHFNTRSVRNAEVDSLAERLAAGPVLQSAAPTPAVTTLSEALSAVGVKLDVTEGRLVLATREPSNAVALARPVAHPWLRDTRLTSIGHPFDAPSPGSADPNLLSARSTVRQLWVQVEKVDRQVAKLAASGAPEKLIGKGVAELEACVREYCEALVAPDLLRWDERAAFTGRAMIAPGADLAIDQVGLPDEMSWGLFGPMLTRALGGDTKSVSDRSGAAAAELDQLMAQSWVLVHSDTFYPIAAHPEYVPASTLACRPVRVPGDVIRIPGRICVLLGADFDGDRNAISLPVTESGQREAGEKLSLRAHLDRSPEAVLALQPRMDSLCGLAGLSLTSEGRKELEQLGLTPLHEGLITKNHVLDILRRMLANSGADAAIALSDRLTRRGFEAARKSGWSVGPFVGHSVALPQKPSPDTWLEAWPRYSEETADVIARKPTFDDNDLDPARISVQSGARGIMPLLLNYVAASYGSVEVDGVTTPIQHSQVDGLTCEESSLLALAARRGWSASLARQIAIGAYADYNAVRNAQCTPAAAQPNAWGHHVLARAMRATCPGAVFARAAAVGEIDPLTDIDSRLFVGLTIE